jgi:hypothetical protein
MAERNTGVCVTQNRKKKIIHTRVVIVVERLRPASSKVMQARVRWSAPTTGSPNPHLKVGCWLVIIIGVGERHPNLPK